MRLRMCSAAVLLAAAGLSGAGAAQAQAAPASPATVADQTQVTAQMSKPRVWRWYDYRYTNVGNVQSGTCGSLATKGTWRYGAAPYEGTLNGEGQIHAYNCTTHKKTKMLLKQQTKATWYGTSVSQCSVAGGGGSCGFGIGSTTYQSEAEFTQSSDRSTSFRVVGGRFATRLVVINTGTWKRGGNSSTDTVSVSKWY